MSEWIIAFLTVAYATWMYPQVARLILAFSTRGRFSNHISFNPWIFLLVWLFSNIPIQVALWLVGLITEWIKSF